MKLLSTGKKQSKFFELAIKEARLAAHNHEVPIGAVLVKDGRVISKAANQTEKRKSFTAHAEMICIERACKKLKSKYLNGCELYLTLEPCLMCKTAAQLSRISKIHYLLKSKKFGSRGKAYFKLKQRKISSTLTPVAVDLLQAFFKERR